MIKKILSPTFTVTFLLVVLSACAGFSPSASPGTTASTPTTPALAQESMQLAEATAVSETSADLLAAYQATLENLYQTVSPSVVNIQVVRQVDTVGFDASQFPGFPFYTLPQDQQPGQQYQSALGSGFVWDNDGHIVTNNHVVSGADKIEITFSDGTIVHATLVGNDPDSDLAVLKVDVSSDLLHPVQMGDSGAVRVGQFAIAIGNPFGLEGTMTTGIISAVGRSLPTSETSNSSYTIPDVIQTDAPINPGNSGGVLVDVQGQVVGVTSAIESTGGSNAGIGFAIPAAIVRNVIPALIEEGEYIHPWLGISGTSLIPDLAEAMDLPSNQRGVLVEEILPNSPAEKVGLKSSSQTVTLDGHTTNVGGDVITAINDQQLNGIDDLIAYLARSTQVDQKVTLTILRDGHQEEIEVTLAARPSSEGRNTAAESTDQNGITLGILGTTVDQSIAEEMDLAKGQKGVLVQEIMTGSLAEEAGLRGGTGTVTLNGQQIRIGGDIITAINGNSVANIQDLKTALSRLTSEDELTITVLRNGREVQITIHPGD